MRERGPWDFPYAPVTTAVGDDDGGPCDVVVATTGAVGPEVLQRALGAVLASPEVEPLLARAPLFWTRVRSASAVTRAEIAGALAAAEVSVRYVASATRASMALARRPSLRGVARAEPRGWRAAKRGHVLPDDPKTAGRWFLREQGVAVDRARCGVGAGMRLAVIDDDAAEDDRLELDALILIGVDRAPRVSCHGGLMVAWATSARGFDGVAPGASRRLYCIPKPGVDVASLPRAIAQAAFDGADVILCATYAEGSTSPMFDDALEVARRLGRRGRGAAVVMPTGREASSAAGTVHSSWSLGLGDPASDPRVFCIGPSARTGGWFMWKDRRGRLRPFANRGPALRWLAPGDDLAYPFAEKERLFHAESSGASAVAAGVLLLVLAQNRRLLARELEAVVTRTLTRLPAEHDRRLVPLADACDVLPARADEDGHNAKHGYGRMNALHACLAAKDPICASLLAMGETFAALAFFDATREARLYTRRAARWTARALLADPALEHGLRALLRHLRLVAGKPSRARAHAGGAVARQGLLFLRGLEGSDQPRTRRVSAELSILGDVLRSASEEPLLALGDALFARAPDDLSASGERPVAAITSAVVSG